MCNNMANRRLLLSIAWVVIGIVLFVLSFMEVLDSFWSGLGGGLIAVGILQIIRHIRYRTNAEYKEKVDIEVNDERNKFLSSKAWAWTGYIFVLCCAVASIVYRVMGENELGSLCTTGLCLMVVIYFIAYMILKRKY